MPKAWLARMNCWTTQQQDSLKQSVFADVFSVKFNTRDPGQTPALNSCTCQMPFRKSQRFVIYKKKKITKLHKDPLK